jgi:hypothetical protein
MNQLSGLSGGAPLDFRWTDRQLMASVNAHGSGDGVPARAPLDNVST